MADQIHSSIKKSVQLNRFLKCHSQYSQRQLRRLILDGKVKIDGVITKDILFPIHAFTHVSLNGVVIQNQTPYYIMLNKPQGVVSATIHDKYKTVVDCIDQPYAKQLHLAGRLDFNTTGLIILTNDGHWSRKISQPKEKIPKTYLLETEAPVTEEYVRVFSKGMYFKFEDIQLLPAHLELISPYQARLTIYEGRYHQVKRMFGYFDNKVTSLHRESIGDIHLDSHLEIGRYRNLSQEEIYSIQ